MKKLAKILATAALAAIICFPALGCASTQYVYGEYSYEFFNYGITYGCKVLVKFKGNKIDHIDLVDAGDWVQLSPSWAYPNGEASPATNNYLSNVRSVLDSFSAYSLDSIMSWKVLTFEEDQMDIFAPRGSIKTNVNDPNQFENVPSVIYTPLGYKEETGATQSLGRIILAVQDAISKKQ